MQRRLLASYVRFIPLDTEKFYTMMEIYLTDPNFSKNDIYKGYFSSMKEKIDEDYIFFYDSLDVLQKEIETNFRNFEIPYFREEKGNLFIGDRLVAHKRQLVNL